MRRKTFDIVLTAGGFVVAVVLFVAGGMLLWGHNFANNEVHNQLAAQQIYFPTAQQLAHPDGKEITPAMQKTLGQYAGQQVLTGPQAKAYADNFINVHLSNMPYGGVYAKASAASQAAPNNTALKGEVQTIFQGTTLRGLLLEAYGFWMFGYIAGIASIISFVLGGVMLVLSCIGVWHLRRVSPEEEVFAPKVATATSKPSFA
jgi:hypothetical protein